MVYFTEKPISRYIENGQEYELKGRTKDGNVNSDLIKYHINPIFVASDKEGILWNFQFMNILFIFLENLDHVRK